MIYSDERRESATSFNHNLRVIGRVIYINYAACLKSVAMRIFRGIQNLSTIPCEGCCGFDFGPGMLLHLDCLRSVVGWLVFAKTISARVVVFKLANRWLYYL